MAQRSKPQPRLAAEGVSAEALVTIKAPAGLDISAISSEEIALSILAEMIAVRRRPQRADRRRARLT
jgi:xanthine dehydrogenase accessory factor